MFVESAGDREGPSGTPLRNRSRTRLDRDIEGEYKERERRNGVLRVLEIMQSPSGCIFAMDPEGRKWLCRVLRHYEDVEDLQLVADRAHDWAHDCTEGSEIELLSLGGDNRHCMA